MTEKQAMRLTAFLIVGYYLGGAASAVAPSVRYASTDLSKFEGSTAAAMAIAPLIFALGGGILGIMAAFLFMGIWEYSATMRHVTGIAVSLAFAGMVGYCLARDLQAGSKFEITTAVLTAPLGPAIFLAGGLTSAVPSALQPAVGYLCLAGIAFVHLWAVWVLVRWVLEKSPAATEVHAPSP